ncbi:MAG TPA: hypothetical protein VER17_18830 [Tepidisphaeraceae bacterium]|nr:hypothetical protein [Tepidisphaeraceae bacterium]
MPDPAISELDELRRRLDRLESDNQRLRDKLEPIIGRDNPCFDATLFQRLLQRRLLWLTLPAYLVLGLAMVLPAFPATREFIPHMNVLGLPLVDFGGRGTRHPGVGVGIIGIGGVGIGLIGIGGLGLGAVAIGGGAVGLIALGGGSLGLIAVGGGATGLVAVGGGAAGRYALGQRGGGRYVLALNRQDEEAIAFFCRYAPELRRAVTRPMPVIPHDAATR